MLLTTQKVHRYIINGLNDLNKILRKHLLTLLKRCLICFNMFRLLHKQSKLSTT